MIIFDILVVFWLFSAANGLLLEALDLAAGRMKMFDPQQDLSESATTFTSSLRPRLHSIQLD